MRFHRSYVAQPGFIPSTLIPYQLISEQPSVAVYEVCGKRLRARQHYRPIILNNSLILFPKWFKGNNSIPLASSSAVRQITKNHINTFIRELPHYFEAIPMNNLIQR